MYQIDMMSRVPVYEQIINQTEKFILTGILGPGDKIPSVRSLSVELSVNPNTIQKAIAELDRRGIVCSVPGKGCFVSDSAKKALMAAGLNNLGELKKMISELRLAMVPKDNILNIVEEVYEND